MLLAFELMHAKPAIVRELVPQEMWPVDKMRKARAEREKLSLFGDQPKLVK